MTLQMDRRYGYNHLQMLFYLEQLGLFNRVILSDKQLLTNP